MKKNILFLLPDQHRGDWLPFRADEARKLGVPSLPVRMENLRRIMDCGTTFTRATTPSPLCVPARACLASGMGYQQSGVYNNDYCYPIDRKTFYSVLREQGYSVGGVGKFDLHKPILYWNKSGWMDQLDRLGFTHGIDSEGKYDLLWSSFYQPQGPYSDFLHQQGLMKEHTKDYIRRFYNVNDTQPTALPDYAYSDNWVTANALHTLDEMRKEQKPWFLQVNFPGPHNPWDVTVSMKERWNDVDFPIPQDYDGSPDELLEVRRNYAAMLENIDRNIGLLLDNLKQAGELENTLIVYASDHGEMLGNKGLYFKCLPWKPSLSIPIVISGPGLRKGAISEELAQLQDLAATFADLADASLPPDRDGRSLLPIARGGAECLREYQHAGLDNAIRHQGAYPGYELLAQHKKTRSDEEYIETFNEEFHLVCTKNSVKKYNFQGHWEAVMTKRHKLVWYSDGRLELFDLERDPTESNNIRNQEPALVQDLLEQLGLSERQREEVHS